MTQTDLDASVEMTNDARVEPTFRHFGMEIIYVLVIRQLLLYFPLLYGENSLENAEIVSYLCLYYSDLFN